MNQRKIPAILSGKVRNYTTYIAGNPGKGKSSLLQQMALHDIRKGRGVCIIDPAADLVNRLIHWIPKERINDTIYFDTDRPIPIDFFGYDPTHPGERRALTDELVAVFNLEGAPVSKPRLYALIGTLLDANQDIPEERNRYTLLDIIPFIHNKKFQEEVLSHCPERKQEWADMPPPKEFYPILDRLRSFTEPGPLRTIFSPADKKLNIAEVMRENKVLLINLNDTETDLFIGSLIAAKFQQATFARRYMKLLERTPYHLYIDECQTIVGYASRYFEKILTRARKYSLCLILANQIPSDLPPEILKKLGTVGTLILFQLDYQDALHFKYRFGLYDVERIPFLSPFHAFGMVNQRPFRLHAPTFLGPSPASYAQVIRNRMITLYPRSTPQMCSTVVDGDRTAKPETISGTSTPSDIPSHKS